LPKRIGERLAKCKTWRTWTLNVHRPGIKVDYLQNSTKQAQVKEYEKQIDQMVYDLYGLTKEEIKIIEEET